MLLKQFKNILKNFFESLKKRKVGKLHKEKPSRKGQK
jgi:hypothetical protein